MKGLEEGNDIENFKSLRYETRSPKQKKKIEDAFVEKMAKWKYFIGELT